MRALYFSRSYTPHDRRFLAALAGSPHEIWYLRLEDDRVRYESRPVPEGVRELHPLGGGPPLSGPEAWIPLVPRLEAVLAEVKPDLVHAGPIQSCALLVALAGFRPLLAMSWGSDILVDARRDEFWNWMTRYALRHAAMLLADCGEVASEAIALGFPRERIVQFPWGVDLDRFRPAPSAPESLVAISTRSWEPNYGVLHLLAGFLRAWRADPRLRLVLLGDGSLRAEVERFIRENLLEEAVSLRGAVPQEELPDTLRAASFYVSCAASDGSSLSLLEAMATALPAIVADRASNREWIAAGVGGTLVPFGDEDAIARALVELAALPLERRREMGRRNRRVVEEHANWEVNVGKLLASYDQVRP